MAYLSQLNVNDNDYDLKDTEARNDLRSTQTVSGNPLTLTDCAPINAESLVVELEPKQEGSGDPSPTNIRPITGYTQTSVDGVGKNLFDKNSVTSGKVIDSHGTEYTLYQGFYSDFIPIKGNTDYYLTNVYGLSTWYTSIHYDKDRNLIGTKDIVGSGNQSGVITSFENSAYMIVNGNNSAVDTVQVEQGSQPTSYEPYASTSATIQFGQTVYGGVSDFVEGGTEDEWGVVEYDGSSDEGWVKNDSFDNTYYTAKPSGINSNNDILANMYVKRTSIASDSGIAFGSMMNVRDNINGATLESFKTFLSNNPLQIVYKKATPTTIQTPPTPLKLLKGTNNITTNGTTINLGYQPDNVIGDVKGEIEEKADNTTKTQPNYYHQYDSTTHKFSDTTRTFNPYDVANILDIMENTRQALETAINDHASLFSQWTFLAEVDSSGASVTIPSSAVRILVELYVIDFSSGNETHVICASLDAEANNPVRDEYIELHGTALNADHYVTGKAIGTDTWITTTNAVARVYYRK